MRILVSGLGDEKAKRSHDERLALYNALVHDYQVEAGRGIVDTRRAIRRDPYWGALEVKYGYAITAPQGAGRTVVLCLRGHVPLVACLHDYTNNGSTAAILAMRLTYLLNPAS